MLMTNNWGAGCIKYFKNGNLRMSIARVIETAEQSTGAYGELFALY
jgi:hypothetical protein